MKLSMMSVAVVFILSRLATAATPSGGATLIEAKEILPEPQFTLVVEDPGSVRTPRIGNRPSDRSWFDTLRLELSDKRAVEAWKSLLQPVLDGRPHERPIQPWIFGYFTKDGNPVYFESDGCTIYSSETNTTGVTNSKVIEWISSQVEIGEYKSICLEHAR